MIQQVQVKTQAFICLLSGCSLIFVGEKPSRVIYRLSGEDAGPVEAPDISPVMYFQNLGPAPEGDLECVELTEEFPFPKLHKYLKLIGKRQAAYYHVRMCLDEDVTLNTRLELCDEIKDEYGDRRIIGFVLKRFRKGIAFICNITFEGLPTEGNLGKIFRKIRAMRALSLKESA